MDTKMYNAKETACNFIDWLTEMGYMETGDKVTDMEEIIVDFIKAQENTPKLFNLLNIISEH